MRPTSSTTRGCFASRCEPKCPTRSAERSPCSRSWPGEHILYDRADGAISGIIDWGDLALGDSDYDLLYLYQDYGADFVRRLLIHSPHAEPIRMMEKLRVFNVCDHLRDVVAARRGSSTSLAVNEAVRALSAVLRQG